MRSRQAIAMRPLHPQQSRTPNFSKFPSICEVPPFLGVEKGTAAGNTGGGGGLVTSVTSSVVHGLIRAFGVELQNVVVVAEVLQNLALLALGR